MAVDKRIVTTNGVEETAALGAEIARSLKAGDSVGLIGDLGAGKTSFVQGMAEGVGIKGYIKSPSFTIINIYDAQKEILPLYHIDLYRIGEANETFELGLEEYIYGDGITVIEWAERASEYMEDFRFVISLTYVSENERRIEIEERAE